ncbi:hypothetical protein ACFL6M_02415 [Candidatus Eisenbacteria bacterium]|uniref:Uncharacterized protein n=1 Tax=Eiseniibacteriota bacterium TaxID=2212470 RepID=A0ABV6YJF9_UNCEI
MLTVTKNGKTISLYKGMSCENAPEAMNWIMSALPTVTEKLDEYIYLEATGDAVRRKFEEVRAEFDAASELAPKSQVS